MPIDDCGLKRTAARRRLQIHRDLDIAQFARKVTRRRVALPKLGRNKPASRMDFARSALPGRVRPRTAVGADVSSAASSSLRSNRFNTSMF